MITTDREPINKQAAIQLSKGSDHLNTIEEALLEIGRRISSPHFAAVVRQMLDSGANVDCSLTIKKGNQPGFVVNLRYQAESQKHQMGTFLGLV